MRSRPTRLVFPAGVLIAITLLMAPLFSAERLPGYRDTVSFYYPLYSWIARQWGNGELPLWNPLQGIGRPVAGEATSALFYPLKVVFALPVHPATRMNLYIILHVVLAAGGVYRWARLWHLSAPAAALAATSYALSGPVLFQIHNVVFLVGAAWLPWALYCCDQLLTTCHARWTIGLGGTVACMVLGGDPQTAYHAAIISLLYLWVIHRSQPAGAPPVPIDRSPRGLLHARPTLLMLAATIAMLLSAVQILPAMRQTRMSRRACFERPRSIWELPEYWNRPAETPRDAAAEDRWQATWLGLFGSPVANTHHREAYQFSVAPWRCVELVWPNFTGRTMPTNDRWLSAIGAEDRIWTPSLYMGLVPLLLALSVWSVRRNTHSRQQWLSWTVLFALSASFGWYGLGWLAREAWRLAGGDPQRWVIGQPAGGLYWLLNVLLPGYALFRYPAKWFPFATLGLAMLAAIGLDRLHENRNILLRRLLGPTLLGTLAAIAVLLLMAVIGIHCFDTAGADELFGPLDSAAVWSGMCHACLYSVILAGCTAWILGMTGPPDADGTHEAAAGRLQAEGILPRTLNRGKQNAPCPDAEGQRSEPAELTGVQRPRTVKQSARFSLAAATGALAVLTACDLLLANRWMVATVPATVLPRI